MMVTQIGTGGGHWLKAVVSRAFSWSRAPMKGQVADRSQEAGGEDWLQHLA